VGAVDCRLKILKSYRLATTANSLSDNLKPANLTYFIRASAWLTTAQKLITSNSGAGAELEAFVSAELRRQLDEKVMANAWKLN
jgi:hypothetical protein